ncbi:MAG: Omp28-related outer membrane protein [Bacteroidales bacterium]|nr:Omp28-related outer membrane protein [Bacteroidales bacterium]MDD4209027.1 Omp28-related outer membrane protein [Bacteroidales bacterium]
MKLKKFIPLLLSCCLLSFFNMQAQSELTVPTEPQKKNFIIEKGTGIACGSCVEKAELCYDIINSHPQGRGIMIMYHFGPDARPQAGPLHVDYKTEYGDSICSPTWPFYLNMMVNRKDRGAPYNSTFVIATDNDQVTPECAALVNEASPVNLAMSSSYDPGTRTITIDVKAYYTANSVTPLNYLQIAITEDSIIGPQYVPPSWNFDSFVHMDMFRANINGFSGDSITTTTQGTSISKQYTYVVPLKYGTESDSTTWVTPNPNHFNLTAYMSEDFYGENDLFGKVQTALRVPLGQSGITGIREISQVHECKLFPNPTTGIVTLTSNEMESVDIQVIDLMGRIVYAKNNVDISSAQLDLSSVNNGLYYIYIQSEKGSSSYKIVLQK